MANSKPLVLVTTDVGCVIPTSHKLNPDGYFRKYIVGHGHTMYHRFVWQREHGPIPEGYEVDHMCKTRACCNVQHLRLLHGDAHAVESNKERYAARTAEAKQFIRDNPQVTGAVVGERFGVTFSTGCRWKREVQAEH